MDQNSRCLYKVNLMAPAKKESTLTIRLSEDDLDSFRAAAEREEMALSDWIRRTCRAALPKPKKK